MQKKLKPVCVSIGGIILKIVSEIPLDFCVGTEAFRVELRQKDDLEFDFETGDFSGELDARLSKEKDPTVLILVYAAEELPTAGIAGASRCGEDSICSYYYDEAQYYELAMPGTDGSVSLAVYRESFQQVNLYVNEKAFPNTVRTVDKILQLLPMKQLLAHYGAFLLHSSRIAVDGKAILFTAPSQTGKTTQARLWERYGGARIAGNDRTLLRFVDDRIRGADAPMVTDRIFDSRKQSNCVITSGYPVDGSSPVYSSEGLPLEAIVVLRQAPENRIQRLSVVKALRCLMEQTALDAWNGAERSAAQEFWLRVLEQVPVYLLECTPDEGAVQCLKRQLEDKY